MPSPKDILPRRLRKFLGAVLHRDRFEDGMADEMRFHMDAYAADLERTGLSRDEARRRARIEFGSPESLKEDCGQSRGLRIVDEVRQDLRYATRQMAIVSQASPRPRCYRSRSASGRTRRSSASWMPCSFAR